MPDDRPRLLGVPADPLTYADLLAQFEAWIEDERPMLHQVCTINPEFLVMAQHNAAFFTLLNRTALNVLDGWGAVWAARWQGVAVPERITGSDGIYRIAERAAQKGWRLFLLGAGEGIADQAAHILAERYQGLQVAGTYGGSPSADEAPAILERIHAAQPDILLVAYGAPRQDLWIDRYGDELPVRVAMGIGGALDFVTGHIPRAPRWMQDWGLEWLYRLMLQPSRWRRMLRLPVFVVYALIFKDQPIKRSLRYAHD